MARVIQDVVMLLNRLIQTEFDAVEARRAALVHFADSGDRHLVGVMLADHRGHVDDLAMVVRNLGGEPLSHGDLRRLLGSRPPPVVPAALDHPVLETLRRHEEGTRDAYREATSRPGVPIDVLGVLDRLLADEHRHLSWLTSRFEEAPRRRRPE
jgi:hypothetical protein